MNRETDRGIIRWMDRQTAESTTGGWADRQTNKADGRKKEIIVWTGC